VRGSVVGIFLRRPKVGVLGPGQVPAREVEVPQPEQDLGLHLPVAEGVHKEGDPLLVAARAAELLRPGEGVLHDLRPRRRGQARGVGQRSEIRSFTVLMSSHVWYLGLPFALLAFRRR